MLGEHRVQNTIWPSHSQASVHWEVESLPQQVPGTSPKRLHKGSSVQWLQEEGFSRQAPACLEKGRGSAVRGHPHSPSPALSLGTIRAASTQPVPK